MNSPTLSIVMPFFNQEELVTTMIDSIVANDFRDWELLAVDDGSEPETHKNLCLRYQADERIRFILRDREPKGAQTCRNMGMEMSSGRYIVFFDSDDYVAPHCLSNRVEQMESHPDLDFMVFRSGTALQQGGKTVFDPKPTDLTFGYPIYKDDIRAFCTRFLPFVVWNNIYRRDSLLKHGITWDTRLLSLQDSMFNLQCLLGGMRYAYSPTLPDYGYRLATPGSVSKKLKSKAHLDSHLYITEQFFTLVQQRYGHRHDHAICRGAKLIMLQADRSENLYKEFNLAMADVARKHSKTWGTLFCIQVRLFHLLCQILNHNRARQIAFLGFLLWAKMKEKSKIYKLK